jgi:hypothetical protein
MATAESHKTRFVPRDVAERYSVDVQRVLDWIHNGSLSALNLARRANGKRPRYVITLEALLDFERRRSVVPPTAPAPRRRKGADPAVTEFF